MLQTVMVSTASLPGYSSNSVGSQPLTHHTAAGVTHPHSRSGREGPSQRSPAAVHLLKWAIIWPLGTRANHLAWPCFASAPPAHAPLSSRSPELIRDAPHPGPHPPLGVVTYLWASRTHSKSGSLATSTVAVL